jgi:23S rRNA pseudouridine1911/1915/1917 synthase
VYGVLKESSGVIDRPIGKSAKDFRKWSAQPGARGTLRDAVTEYQVVRQGTEATFVEVRPQTGRTHQIRVHFKAIHHPVVCDALYAPRNDRILGFNRLALHARQLSFRLMDGTMLTAEAPLPEDFQHALTVL